LADEICINNVLHDSDTNSMEHTAVSILRFSTVAWSLMALQHMLEPPVSLAIINYHRIIFHPEVVISADLSHILPQY